MKSLNCQACGAPLSAESFDRRLAIVTCTNCGSIFDLASRGARSTADAAPKGASPERAPVSLPERFDVQGSGRNIRIRWRWFKVAELFLIPFAIAWNVFLVGWYSIAFGVGSDVPGGMGLIMMVFPLAHVAVGVGVAYRAVANLVNRTTVAAVDGTLRVRHGPLPWWPNPTVPLRDLEQLYVTRKVVRGKNGTSVTFELRAVTRAHRTQLLLGGLAALDQALWLEQELERALDIRDRAVAGEYKGDDHRT